MTVECVTPGTVLTMESGQTLATNRPDMEQISQDIDRIYAFVEQAYQTTQLLITPPHTPALRELTDAAKRERRMLFVLTHSRCCCLHVCPAHTGVIIVHLETDDLPDAVPYTMEE